MLNKQDCKSSSPEFYFLLCYLNLGKYFKVKNAGWQIPMQRPCFDALWGFCGVFMMPLQCIAVHVQEFYLALICRS